MSLIRNPTAGPIRRGMTTAPVVKESHAEINWREPSLLRERQTIPREQDASRLQLHDEEIPNRCLPVTAREITDELPLRMVRKITHNSVIGHMNQLGYFGREYRSSLDERLQWEQVITTGCRWIDGEPGTGKPWHYCGAPIGRYVTTPDGGRTITPTLGGSWCAEHHARVWVSSQDAEGSRRPRAAYPVPDP